MAAILPNVPSVKTFTDAWTKKFEETVRTAAGKDGRLSVTEARRIAERVDGGQHFSDNAVGYLNATKQKSVSVSKLVQSGRAYAQASAQSAAGADGRLSFADGQKLRPDLRDDFLFLRGKTVEAVQPTPQQLKTDVTDFILRAFDNGTARKLSGPPAIVKGRKPVVEQLPHAPSNTRLSAYVADGRVYVSRSSNQTGTGLVGWYDVGPVPQKSTMSDLRARFESAMNGMWLMSESDAQLKFIASSAGVAGATTAELVKRVFGKTHDALGPTLYGSLDPNFVKLADRAQVQEMNGYAWIEGQGEVSDPDDPAAVAEAARWQNLAKLVKSELTDVKVIRFGETNITMMLVGQTKTGELAGFMSAVVET